MDIQIPTRSCRVCNSKFVIASEDLDFYKHRGVLPPSLCPDCRFQRRSVFRLERSLYKRPCDNCKASIVSMYHPDAPFTVYCLSCYESDGWDPYSYGRPYDFSRPFFDQMRELMLVVPKQALYIAGGSQNINSEYTNYAGPNKDSYLIFNAGPECDTAFYSRGLRYSRAVSDIYFGISLEQSYEIVNGQQSSGVRYGQNVNGCVDSWFLLNCSGCTNCFGCVNLRNASYCFFNEQLEKSAYLEKVASIVGSYRAIEEYRNKFESFSLQFPRRENNNLKSTNVIGDYIFESNDVKYCFEVTRGEHCRYSAFLAPGAKDCYDATGYSTNSELLLEATSVGLSSRVISSAGIIGCQDIEYSFALRQSSDCFGCDGLRNAKYAVLNTTYSKEEYAKITDYIRNELRDMNEYGLSFPPSLALGAYNESIGQDNFPLTKEEALARGFGWRDDIFETKGKETLAHDDIPDQIRDVQDSITNEILACGTCGKNYKIIPAELELYRMLLVPVPRQCFNCRHNARLAKRGPFRFVTHVCAKCGKSITTRYGSDSGEVIYCEQCYQAEVV